MPTLAELISKPPKRTAVVADLARFVDAEVSHKSGLSGVAIKMAYGALKVVKSTFVPEVIDSLFDDWVKDLEPVFARSLAENQGSAAGLGRRPDTLNVRDGGFFDAVLSISPPINRTLS